MKKLTYLLGSIILFFGIVWLLLPHASHAELIENDSPHYVHILQGVFLTLIGLALLIYSTREQNHPILNIFKSKSRK